MSTITITYSPKQHAEVPRAWKKAAGILRASTKRNTAESKKLRREWNKRARIVATAIHRSIPLATRDKKMHSVPGVVFADI